MKKKKVSFIKIIVFTVFILTATFSMCITVLYYQKSQEYSIARKVHRKLAMVSVVDASKAAWRRTHESWLLV